MNASATRSADSGRTWSQPQEVYNREMDDRDPNLLTMPDGTIILTLVSTTDFVPYVIDGKFIEGTAIPERWQSQWLALCHRMNLTDQAPQRNWLMRSAWMAQELLSTCSLEIGAVTLEPRTGGIFEIWVDDELIWERKRDGGFPKTKPIKQMIRDRIDPARGLGHSDR